MRRSIDDHPFDPAEDPVVADDPDLQHISWAVAIADDYDGTTPRVVLTVEEIGRAGAGLIAHLQPRDARRLRVALRDALKEIGEDPGVWCFVSSMRWSGEAVLDRVDLAPLRRRSAPRRRGGPRIGVRIRWPSLNGRTGVPALSRPASPARLLRPAPGRRRRYEVRTVVRPEPLARQEPSPIRSKRPTA